MLPIRDVVRLLIGIVFVLMLPLSFSALAQDPTTPPLSEEQRALLAQIDAADADQNTWQSYKTVSFSKVFYSESLTISPENTVLFQRDIDTTATSVFQGNPRLGPSYNRDTLMTIGFKEVSAFSANAEPQEENYTLLVEVLYVNQRLFAQALRNDGSEFLPAVPDGWQEVTANPEQFEALQVVNLSRYLPTAAPRPALNPLIDVDFIELLRAIPLRDLISDIEFVQAETLEGGTESPNVGRQVNQIRVRLNPRLLLLEAFEGNENQNALVDAFLNENVEMTMTIWLDTATSQRVRERFVFLVQGDPDPRAFGYVEGDLTPESTMAIQLLQEIEIDYSEINVPVQLQVPPGF